MSERFRDRRDAARRLAEHLEVYRNRDDVLILALPRGGVVIGWELAVALNCPLDLLLVRKIGAPGNPELAVAAISETEARVVNQEVFAGLGLTDHYLQQEMQRQLLEIERRRALYRGGRSIRDPAGKTILLVDDGVATGATLQAAIATLRRQVLERLVVAVPVAPLVTARRIEAQVDEWICLRTPEDFSAVGNYYEEFDQVTDAEVIEMLREMPADPARR